MVLTDEDETERDVMPSYVGWVSAMLLVCTMLLGCESGDNGSQSPQESPEQESFEEFRSLDGTDNNLQHPTWGSVGEALLRFTTVAYDDGVERPAGSNRPSARAISNAVAAQTESMPNPTGVSDLFWQWGQFLDHDIDLTPAADPPEPFDIPVPLGDPFFDPQGTGNRSIPLHRSAFVRVDGIRQQINQITAYIDASQVYGSDVERALAMRSLDGSGELKSSDGYLLPFNEPGYPNDPDPNDPEMFLAGDVRANEQVGLTAMHILFMREHNHWARLFRVQFPDLSGDGIYERARAMVAAEMQAITYNEFLPLLLGPQALTPYTGYRPEVNAGIANVFSTAAYRLGHSMVSSHLLRLDRHGEPIPEGHLFLEEAFFNPHVLIHEGGIEPLLRGLVSQVAQTLDTRLVDAIRNFLFGPPGSGGFDLAALNIQRARDHGLPGYNQVRQDYGLPPVTSFADISSNPATQELLIEMYATVEDIDIWVGGLAEDHVPVALVGETFWTIIKDQFERLRDGDRFWYQHYLPGPWADAVERRRLVDIITANTTIEPEELPENVFLVP